MNTQPALETNNTQIKENWSKPEINLIGINEETLGSGFTNPDSGASS